MNKKRKEPLDFILAAMNTQETRKINFFGKQLAYTIITHKDFNIALAMSSQELFKYHKTGENPTKFSLIYLGENTTPTPHSPEIEITISKPANHISLMHYETSNVPNFPSAAYRTLTDLGFHIFQKQ